MTHLEIRLRDDLAREADHEGLLEPQPLEQLLRERLRALRLARLAEARARARARARVDDTLPAPMTAEEIQAEIDAYRAEQRGAPGP
ncbi:MAG: hypothetical protein P8Y25_09330 [Chromatiaceae bacterium]|jgi:hypothetical protein